ncbi:MAG: hypothetical protein WD014_05300 [Dongiaceae bacterium]
MGKIHRSGPGEGRRSAAPPPKIDRDRLVWDPEYRAEIRNRLKGGDGAARSAGRAAPWPPPDSGVD